MTFRELAKVVIDFRDKRNWKQFHNPKDLAISLSLEAAEVLECFQWKSADEIEEVINGKGKMALQEELADVASYLLLLCNEAGIDLEEAIRDKVAKNEIKYPVEKSRGSAKKYNEL